MLKKFPVTKNNKEYRVVIIDTIFRDRYEINLYKKINFKLFWLININTYKALYTIYLDIYEDNVDFIKIANTAIDKYENAIQREIDYQNSIKEAEDKFNKWDGVL